MPDGFLHVTYELRTLASRLAARVEALLLEQTVEVSRAALHVLRPATDLTGRIVAEAECEPGVHRVTLAQPVAAIQGDPALLLSVLFGSCSLQDDVTLLDVQVPDALALALGGPRFGLEGWRRRSGAESRALTCGVLKPLGAAAEQLGALCGTLAAAGFDVIKDDHGLGDQPAASFVDRLRLALDAIDTAAQTTGRRALYVPNLIGSPGRVRDQIRIARDVGVEAIMLSPALLGLPFLHELVRGPRPLELPVLAHPAGSGNPRIAPEVMLGVLFPLLGADAVLFPHAGGRFAFSTATCHTLARELRRPAAAIAPALPVTGGGSSPARVAELLTFHGTDTMLLAGSSLLEAGADLPARARDFVAAVHAFSPPAGT